MPLLPPNTKVKALLLSLFGLTFNLGAWAFVVEVPAGQSPLPAATGAAKVKPEEIVAAFQKDKDAATAQYGTKPIRITGQVKGFNPDHAFAHDQDLFILLTPEGSPCEVYVCFSRPQLETTFRFPADKKPKVTNPSYAGYTRQIEQGYTKPYFDRDLNMIALHDSETLSPPASTAKTGPKPTPVGFSADKIPLVAVGDPIDVDVLFEQAAPDGSVIFNATAIPPAPVKK